MFCCKSSSSPQWWSDLFITLIVLTYKKPSKARIFFLVSEMINILMYSNKMCCEALSIHRKYTKYTRKQAHKQVLASITRTKHAEKNFLFITPKFLTINHITCLLKTENCRRTKNTFHNSNIKITTIKPTTKSNTLPLKACHKFTSLLKSSAKGI